MRLSELKRSNVDSSKSNFKIIGLDDEIGIIKTLNVLLDREGYYFKGYTDHVEAIEDIKNNDYGLLILDYLLLNINAKEVVEIIRSFNKELYILLLTGHSECAPPMETLDKNDIQGYCTKSDDPRQLLLMVKSAFKSISMMNDIRLTRNGLDSILKSVPRIYQLQPIDIILEEILSNILNIVHSADAFILVDRLEGTEENSKESIYRGIGKYNIDIETFTTLFNPLQMMFAGSARMNSQVVKHEGGVFFPLLNDKRESIGVIFVDALDEKYISLLEVFSNQAASSINNAFLHSMINIKNSELKMTYEIIRTRYEETVDTLRLAVDAKDEYTRGHSDRVSKYAVEIAKCFSHLTEHDYNLLRVGGTFHDIGKIGTADDILLSDRKLSDSEFHEIQKHPLTGAKILSALSMFQDTVPLVLCHHERVDGSGYPNRLKGDEIPFLARILSVADAFDAMTTNRVYRSKLPLEAAMAQLQKGAGTQFDPDIVEKFVDLLRSGAIKLDE
ncbi:HD domain-containing response regulator [Pseudobacteroides cellulosolvens]|uniref:Stage 0 sporulation protein A homolog n=1 Tax=Pseudobacteroides cellulosolvens ATCC 35603 = DSM 2933 TaxID=398512 RepID=A0A0L6JIT7_9FIRM|nr:HD domain-containing response regulator [Pseudobacteroides cellulosolvens]KNY25608.1 metal dependent phosphohydrolase [Pseudobacteroides cellulosolvens ATCC 35603 = DSM 2933]